MLSKAPVHKGKDSLKKRLEMDEIRENTQGNLVN